MRKLIVSFLLFSYMFCFGQKTNSIDLKRNIPFDANWLFIKDSLSDAEYPEFDDSKWKRVELPHDWSINDLPNPIPDSISGPFFKGNIGNFATGFTVGGTGWYRKKFITEASMLIRFFALL